MAAESDHQKDHKGRIMTCLDRVGIDSNSQEIIWGYYRFRGVMYARMMLPQGLGVGSSISVCKNGFLVTTGLSYVLCWNGRWLVSERREYYDTYGTLDGCIEHREGMLIKYGKGSPIETPCNTFRVAVSESGFVAAFVNGRTVVFDTDLSSKQTLTFHHNAQFAGDSLISYSVFGMQRWEIDKGVWCQTGSITEQQYPSSTNAFLGKIVITENKRLKIVDFDTKEITSIDVDDMTYSHAVMMPCGKLVYTTKNGIGVFDMQSGAKKEIPTSGRFQAMTVKNGVLLILFPDRVECWY